MYTLTEILNAVALFGIFYILAGIPCAIGILLLALHNKRTGNVPPDIDIQAVVIHGFVIWPKVVLMVSLNALSTASEWLLKFITQTQDEAKSESEAKAFTHVFRQRLSENSKLIEFLEEAKVAIPHGDDGGGFIGMEISRMSGTTYMVLLTNRDFLKGIRQEDGTYDEESMERLNSLEPWMVFDLVCEFPEYGELLPPEIISQISVQH
jgi:hypothetical protein